MTSAQDRPVRVAMVGLGWWGRKMVVVLEGARAHLEVVCAVEPAPGAEEFCAEHGLKLLANYADALQNPDVEAVILATPHSLHEQQIEDAVAAGKHVFCEKPLAMTKAGAEKAVALCREAGLVLGMGHERRFEPPIAGMLAAAADGRLGRILQVEANFSHDKFLGLDPSNWRLNASQAPAAGMTATGIHLTDLSAKLLGPARDVRVACENLASQIPQGDTLSAHIRFHGGGTAYVSATLATPFVSRFAVFGTKGWIEVRDKAHVEAPAGWVVTSASTGTPIEVEEVGPAEPVRDNLVAFAAAVRGRQAYPITGEDMINNIAILESIIKSAATGMVETVG
ncbi:Gfo/Idh/MocA family oxidoreductase [Mesorhizobium sp. YC-39]|uniref:Gfo/Idh/MocA family protein n=1 Tax=unclassified Mesorhizobium TaxID=325217 RepID=UPI0021E8FAF7|nr:MULTISPECIES: Gfo/Idh/MocA family oxidoreductase [unclassified Mesorhizobium]MCV3206624.1 Gfo/Idh/MocA family oxidoreductase [Mesorhizobium sp. YC-2]MCV3226976.1 Gfo/Idh/MocA family oxidoreductase [Mesorhizobium sp. YC-39]